MESPEALTARSADVRGRDGTCEDLEPTTLLTTQACDVAGQAPRVERPDNVTFEEGSSASFWDCRPYSRPSLGHTMKTGAKDPFSRREGGALEVLPRANDSSRRPRPVVVGVDGSASSKAALVWAARQAKISGASLSAVIAWEFPTNYGWPYATPDEIDPAADAKSLLENTMREVLGPVRDIETSVAVVQGHPASVLVEMSKTASLIVVGSRGHGEIAGMLLGSVSEYLTAHAHCPVAVVRDGHGTRRAS